MSESETTRVSEANPSRVSKVTRELQSLVRRDFVKPPLTALEIQRELQSLATVPSLRSHLNRCPPSKDSFQSKAQQIQSFLEQYKPSHTSESEKGETSTLFWHYNHRRQSVVLLVNARIKKSQSVLSRNDFVQHLKTHFLSF